MTITTLNDFAIVAPVAILDALLTSSNVAETAGVTDPAAWNAATAYVAGDQVTRIGANQHQIYQRLINRSWPLRPTRSAPCWSCAPCRPSPTPAARRYRTRSITPTRFSLATWARNRGVSVETVLARWPMARPSSGSRASVPASWMGLSTLDALIAKLSGASLAAAH